MKKINLSFLVLLCSLLLSGIQVTAADIVPQDGVNYYILSYNGMVISKPTTGTNATVQTPMFTTNQQFQFVQTDYNGLTDHTYYNLQLQSNSQYLGKNGYNSIWSTSATAATSIVWVNPVAGTDSVWIEFAGTTTGLGLDAGSTSIWTDKSSATLNRYKWRLISQNNLGDGFSASQIFSLLATAITNANTALATVGVFPDSTKLALTTAIATATVLTVSSTQADILAAIPNLGAKTTAYLNSQILPIIHPTAGINYYIYTINATDGTRRYITANTNKVDLGDQAYDPTGTATGGQLFRFDSIAPTDVAFTKSYNQYYISNSNDATRIMTGDPKLYSSTTEVAWRPKYVKTVNGVMFFTLQSTLGKYMYSQGEGGAIWNNSTYSTAAAYLFAIEDESVQLRAKLKTIYTSSNLLYQTTVSGTGAGQYPSDVRTALGTALQDGQTVYNNVNATVAQINAAMAELNGAVATYNAALIVPAFVPVAGANYRILSINTSYPKYLSSTITSNKMVSEAFASGAAEQQWQFVKVDSVNYTLQNGGNVLTYVKYATNSTAFTLTPLNTNAAIADTTQYVRFVYASTAQGTNYYRVSTIDSTRAIGLYLGNYLRLEATNLASTYQPVQFIQVNTSTDLDKSALDNAVKAANTLYFGAIVGTSEGQYPQPPYNAFKTAIDAASALLVNSQAAQTDLTAMVTTLATATSAFNNSIVVNFEAFRALIVSTTTTLNAAVVGPNTGNYLQSTVDTLTAALKTARNVYGTGVVELSDNNALTGAITAFKANTGAVAIATVLTDAITSATTLYTNAIEGTTVGQYAAGSKATFNTAIGAAQDTASTSGVTTAQLTTALTTLATARATFVGGVVSVNLTALQAAITTAQAALNAAVQGSFTGQYPANAFVTLNAVVNIASEVLGVAPQDQSIIDVSTQTVVNATATFASQKIVINFTVLNADIIKAKAYANSIIATDGSDLKTALNTFNGVITGVSTIATTLAGSTTVSQDSVNNVIAVIDSANVHLQLILNVDLAGGITRGNVYTSTTVAANGTTLAIALGTLKIAVGVAFNMNDTLYTPQKGITQEVATLNTAIGTFKTALITSIGLQDSINVALGIYNKAVTGDLPGQYSSDTKANFNDSIAVAQLIITEDLPVSQAAMLTAARALNSAMNSFISLVNPPVDLSGLDDAISQVQVFLASTTTIYGNLINLLQQAQTLEASNTESQVDVDNMTAKLLALLANPTAQGIANVMNDKVSIYAAGNTLFVKGLPESCRIAVYSINGQLLSSVTKSAGNDYTFVLTTGKYVATVQGEEVNKNQVIIIK